MRDGIGVWQEYTWGVVHYIWCVVCLRPIVLMHAIAFGVFIFLVELWVARVLLFVCVPFWLFW